MKKLDQRTGAERIADERQRQIEKCGWTPAHDDANEDGELALAAIAYAAPHAVYVARQGHDWIHFDDPFPWDRDDDKRPYKRAPTPEERIRLLERAGALIAAEIDRLLRAERKKDVP